MIATLSGTLTHKFLDHIIVDVNGIGYRVHVPLSTFYELPELNARVNLNIHTHVREDLIHLYGFYSMQEKEMFLRLIDIAGVGPKLALGILSGITAADLRAAIWAGDITRLNRIKGVGKKTAQRIVIELKDKLNKAETDLALPTLSGDSPDKIADTVSALLNLGYTLKESEDAVKRTVRDNGDDLSLEELIRKSLKALI